MAPKQKKAPSKPKALPRSSPPPEPYQDRQALQKAYRDAVEAMTELADEYGAEETPERLIQRARGILSASTLEEATRIARRAWDGMLVHVLSQWAKGRIPGKRSNLAFERNIKKALSLASMLDGRGLSSQAQSQRERAERLREEWEEFKSEVSRGVIQPGLD